MIPSVIDAIQPSAIRVKEPAIDAGLAAWLDDHALYLDSDAGSASEIVPRLGHAGLFRIGVDVALGGVGGTTCDAIKAIASVARHSLSAAFVFWGQRTFIEYLLQSDNATLRDKWLPSLLHGEHAGATGLSNAMKYLSAIEPLKARAHALDAGASRFSLNGALPWITNLRQEGFLAAVAFDRDAGAPPAIFAVPHDIAGVCRSDDLDLIALRASNTAALTFKNVELDARWIIASDARAFLMHARPAFLGLQCGMSIGLARRSLDAVDACGDAAQAALADELAELRSRLDALCEPLYHGVDSGVFVAAPARQFEIRIALAQIAVAASQLELQAAGGRGYLRNASDTGPARRARETAFVPIITPSVVQLKNQLAHHRQQGAA
ncbi:acyl-CoA dehydrogenase family protein [Robbsia andropogonis]|uniref:acyl-CoA dehydrogenase family protein n=1 Tax=Robbsia andropogonis TaxID=28092 RepID=UPI003D1A7767